VGILQRALELRPEPARSPEVGQQLLVWVLDRPIERGDPAARTPDALGGDEQARVVTGLEKEVDAPRAVPILAWLAARWLLAGHVGHVQLVGRDEPKARPDRSRLRDRGAVPLRERALELRKSVRVCVDRPVDCREGGNERLGRLARRRATAAPGRDEPAIGETSTRDRVDDAGDQLARDGGRVLALCRTVAGLGEAHGRQRLGQGADPLRVGGIGRREPASLEPSVDVPRNARENPAAGGQIEGDEGKPRQRVHRIADSRALGRGARELEQGVEAGSGWQREGGDAPMGQPRRGSLG